MKRSLSVVATVVLVATVAFAKEPADGAARRAGEFRTALESAVAKGHPRLFADAAAFARLKASAAEANLRGLAAKRIVERADLQVGEPLLTRKMIGRRLLHTSRAALYRISTLAMAYRLTGDAKYLRRAEAELKAVCAFADWNPSHFLDVGEMSLAVAVGYDWLYDGLSEDSRREIRAGLARCGLAAGRAGGWWAKASNNWGQVCRAGMIAAAVTLAEDPALFDGCAKMLGESVAALPIAMKAMAPNGCYPEGTGYWHYGVSFNVFALAMLESACGTDFGLSNEPGFRETADYPSRVTGPSDLTIGYSDCGSGRGDMQVLWWFAKKLNRPDLVSKFELSVWDRPPKRGDWGWLPPVELFWMDDRAVGRTVAPSLPRVWDSKGPVPIAILRSGWTKDDSFLGIKGGRPDSPHGHMDCGNFVLDMGGIRWAWELAHEDYNRLEQMKGFNLWGMQQDSDRWKLLRLGTHGHNVPSVDGAQQAVKGFAKFLSVTERPTLGAELDLTGLYPAAKKVIRSYALAADGRGMTVKDVFEGLKPGARVRWQFVTKTTAAASGAKVRLTEGGRAVEVVRTGTAATDWKVAPAEGEKPVNTPNPGFSIVSFELTADGDGRAAAEVSFALSDGAGAAAGATLTAGYGGEVRLDESAANFAPRLFTKSWGTCSVKGKWVPDADGSYAFTLVDGHEKIVDGRARQSVADGKAKLSWSFDVLKDFAGNAFCLSLELPTDTYAGGSVAFGPKTVSLPAEPSEKPWIGGANCREIRVTGSKGRVFGFVLGENVYASVQDNRKWNTPTFSIRLALGDAKLKEGEKRSLELTLTADGGIGEIARGPVTIAANADWVPLGDTTDIVPGSALDFSKLGWMDAPAGKHGRVVAKGAHFEFEGMPGVPQRFYGCNLCFSANYLSEREADELCARMARIGYNALRIHHYERELCDPKDGTTIRPEKMAELDNLLNACIANGIYLTTDLFVSRGVKYRACGIDRDGEIPMNEFKELALVNDRVRANYRLFAKNFLGHVNPKTGRRWADEPALGFLALINEGNLGNFGYGFLSKQPDFRAKWKAWLAARRAEAPAQYADITEKFPDNCWENSRQNAAVSLFLADIETAFCEEMRRFLREEVGTKVLLTDLSCWKNPIHYQLVRTHYDYVDDHFYVDHPQFLERSWSLPSKCPNVNPVRGFAAGFEGVARHRLLDRPFTITEFNYSGPGQFRGVGGMMLGAQAALQEYDGIWRFAWSHSRDAVLAPKPITYFDVARDPLQRATERAVLTLYLRRDLKPLANSFAAVIPEKKLRSDFDHGPQLDLRDMWFGWYSRFGTWVGEGKPPFATAFGEFPGVFDEKTAHFRSLAGTRRPGDGQIAIDRENGVFGVDTARTQGFFAEGGRHTAGALTASVSGAPAAVWASSLDGKDVATSRRLLLTHVTDVQDAGTTYADPAKTILIKWGRLPHMMHAGRAEISLAFADGPGGKVYALAADGSRRGEVPATWKGGTLFFTADTARDRSDATYLYEIVR